MTDVPTLLFVDPNETESTYRICLWSAPGSGKSVAAASAPDPILIVTADRPSAYKFARKHHAGKVLHEVRYRDANTLTAVYAYLSSEEGAHIRTVVLDPISSIYDQLVDTAPLNRDGDPDYQKVNKKLLGFVQSLRKFDINVVLVAHEKLNDGKKGDGKLYPALGGPALINKLLAEMDIVAHIERRAPKEGEDTPRWVGQLQPRDNLVCKEATGGFLGDLRVADLSRWIEVANEGLAPDDSDLPWADDDGSDSAASDEEPKAEQADPAAPGADQPGEGAQDQQQAADGGQVSGGERVGTISEAQAKRLRAKAGEYKLDDDQALHAIVDWIAGVQHIADIPKARYDDVIDAIANWRAALAMLSQKAAQDDDRAREVFDRHLGQQAAA